MEIEADYDRCIGAGMCVVSAPQVFDQDEDDGTVIVLNARPVGEDAVGARDAVMVCPASALAIREDGEP
ncbi:ferredoxin [Nonomuraea antimicrobica]|uniref:Ferredoxin n=1 Tax=Nonomuraea antimicrobica TaxID=561173 RepID=A0ABP7DAJ8_9ACTN